MTKMRLLENLQRSSSTRAGFIVPPSGSRKLSLLKEKIAFRMGAFLSLKINRYYGVTRSSLKLRRTHLDWSFFA